MNHRLSCTAAKGVGEFRHIAHHVVYSIAAEGVALRHHCGASGFRAQFSTPDVGVRKEEVL